MMVSSSPYDVMFFWDIGTMNSGQGMGYALKLAQPPPAIDD